MGRGENRTVHTGIYNIHRRSQLLYGAAYGMEIARRAGGGTRVTMVLPADGGKGVKKMQRVLIVEDEEIIRKGLVCTIDWAAMNCVVVGDAGDGIAGLELLRTTHPDILLTDIRMPRMDGITMAEYARDAGILPQLIFLTSYAEFDYAKRAIELQAADYLLKPVNEEELAALLYRLAEQKKDKTKTEPLSEGLDWARYFSDDGLNPYVRYAMERIRCDYRDKLSIEQLAEEFGVSASYLSRKFKEVLGQTFLEALTRQRLQKAVSQLASGKYRVYEIAENNGFGDYKNFCSVFKKYMHISPRDFLHSVQDRVRQKEE